MTRTTRFEQQLRLACYRSITRKLAEAHLITKDEESRIGKKILVLEESLIRPEVEENSVHERGMTTTE